MMSGIHLRAEQRKEFETYRELNAEKRGEYMNKRDIQMIARRASGEYMMKHIAGIMEVVEDTRLRNKDKALDEDTLVIIETRVKAIAEGLVHSNGEMKGHDR
jgi:hypothetical protein